MAHGRAGVHRAQAAVFPGRNVHDVYGRGESPEGRGQGTRHREGGRPLRPGGSPEWWRNISRNFVVSRTVETGCESIPQVILQALALASVDTAERARGQYLSISWSILNISYTFVAVAVGMAVGTSAAHRNCATPPPTPPTHRFR